MYVKRYLLLLQVTIITPNLIPLTDKRKDFCSSSVYTISYTGKSTHRSLKWSSPSFPSFDSGSIGLGFSVALASASSLLSGAGSGAVGVCGLLPPEGWTKIENL